MAVFRQRGDVVIEATQWFSGMKDPNVCTGGASYMLVQVARAAMQHGGPHVEEDHVIEPHWHLGHTQIAMTDGTWIVTSAEGQRLPVIDSAFRDIYEPAEGPGPAEIRAMLESTRQALLSAVERVHQAHHGRERATWNECPQAVCRDARKVLRQEAP